MQYTGQRKLKENPAPKDHSTDWQCKVCKGWYVVPTMARDCEGRHDRNE